MNDTGTRVRLAVVGAHLRGEPLNGQLTDRNARLVRSTTTAPCYRLFALDTVPPKPGLARVAHDAGGTAIEVEVWELGLAEFGDFVAQVPAPMCIGKLVLSDGTEVSGFLCEPYALESAQEITAFGGWRAYRSSTDDRS
jgi:allophanate hydrolase